MSCPICSGEMEKLIYLPKFPVTEGIGFVDQAFLYCKVCSHGKLETILPQPRNTTMGERGYLEVFADFVRLHSRNLVVDIGGNDGALCSLLDSCVSVVIDGDQRIEEADLSHLKGRSKLIVSSHTLEHIRHPGKFFSQVDSILGPDDIFALQVPSLEFLVDDCRIDQIHHQHYHYFSERSITTLLARYGMEVIASKFNPDHWGALMLVCKRGKGRISGRHIYASDITLANAMFKTLMIACRGALSGRMFACYGASPMLPVLMYYLPIHQAEFIADDLKGPKTCEDLKDRNVLITAVSKMTARKLVKKAFDIGARNVITPFHQL